MLEKTTCWRKKYNELDINGSFHHLFALPYTDSMEKGGK